MASDDAHAIDPDRPSAEPEAALDEALADPRAGDREQSAEIRILRRQIARDRARVAADREDAARDRERAAQARAEAARAREQAARERAEAARDRQLATTDSLTGARTRGAGLEELQREMDRARRTTSSLVLAFVDVDGLKQVNDTEGHLAGDSLLATVAHALRGGLRSYDLIVRYGGDEFLCALSGIGIDEVQRRFDGLAATLAGASNGHSISAGFAALQDGDDTQALIARADEALLQSRQAD